MMKPWYSERLPISFFFFFLLSVLVIFAGGQDAGAAPTSERLLTTGERPIEKVKIFIDESEVMVFAKSYCPYCKRTRSLFDQIVQENAELDIFVNILDLDTLPEDDGRMMQQALHELTGQRTVPNVFIAGSHVGGNDDTHTLFRSGELLEALEDIASSREL